MASLIVSAPTCGRCELTAYQTFCELSLWRHLSGLSTAMHTEFQRKILLVARLYDPASTFHLPEIRPDLVPLISHLVVFKTSWSRDSSYKDRITYCCARQSIGDITIDFGQGVR